MTDLQPSWTGPESTFSEIELEVPESRAYSWNPYTRMGRSGNLVVADTWKRWMEFDDSEFDVFEIAGWNFMTRTPRWTLWNPQRTPGFPERGSLVQGTTGVPDGLNGTGRDKGLDVKWMSEDDTSFQTRDRGTEETADISL